MREKPNQGAPSASDPSYEASVSPASAAAEMVRGERDPGSSDATAVAVIMGSAFNSDTLENTQLLPIEVPTAEGLVTLHRVQGVPRPAFVLFRHGVPHQRLPNQIPFRAHALALSAVGCGALLVTSSVGVLDEALPLYEPLLVSDLLTLDNRLPDGSACTLFQTPSASHGHLVLEEGLFSRVLSDRVDALALAAGAPIRGRVVFGYVAGPRTKTAAENRMWRLLGAQVNSMSVGPEVVLANELGIPCAGLAVGHKYSLGVPSANEDVACSLESSRRSLEAVALSFVREAGPVSFGNRVHRFSRAAR